MRRLLCVWMVVALSGVLAGADELSDTGRSLLTKYDAAVVTLRLTVKETYSSPDSGTQDQEYTMERPGVVVDASGLTVTSLYMVDPTIAESAPEEDGVKYSINVTNAKMIRPDGKELAVKLVLRDKDLDVAVFRLEQALAEPVPFIDMTQAASPQALDPLVLLLRLDKVAGRTAAAGVVRINAVPKKPRQYYVVGQADQMIGAAAFTVKGEPVGLVTLRWTELTEEEALSMFGAGSMSEIPVVLPASDLLDVVNQAREAKADATPAAVEKVPAP